MIFPTNCLRFCAVIFLLGSTFAQAELPIKIAELEREKPVDFATEIYPLLKQNCVACHHAKESEGGLNLESYKVLMKGGDSGPAVVAKQSDDSLLLARACGVEEPLMPPEDNTVGAKPLTPEQLGLLKLWIQQGAVGGEISHAETINWQPIPETVRTIYSLAVSPDGQTLASGHGNRVVIYDVPTGKETARLVDAGLESISGPGVADVDMIQSIAFSPDGERIATGGFRTVRIWKKSFEPGNENAPMRFAAGPIATPPTHSHVAFVNAIGDIEVWDREANQKQHTLTDHTDSICGMSWAGATDRLASCDVSGTVALWQPSTGKLLHKTESGTIPSHLSISPDGNFIAAVGLDRKVKLWSASTGLQPAELAAATPIADAITLTFASKPVPMLVVSSESAGVMQIGLADGKLIRKVDHGSVVEALAVNHQETQFATGGRDGKTRVWKIDDGAAIGTLQGDRHTTIQLVVADRDAKRQTAAVTRLETRTGELEKALEKENELVKKVTEERDKAKAKVAEEEKKRVEAVAKVTATEGNIATTKSAMTSAESLVATTTKKIAEQEALKKTAAAEVAQAKAARDKVAQMLAAEEAKFKSAMAKAAELDGVLTKVKAEQQAATKAVTDAKSKLETLAKQLEGEQKAATTAAEAKKKSDSDLVKREQALSAAAQAQQRASAAVPAHKLIVESEKQRAAFLQQRLTDVQQRASDPANAVAAIAFQPNTTRLATSHRDGTVRIYDVASGMSVDHWNDANGSPAATGIGFVGAAICRFGHRMAAWVRPLATKWRLERTIGKLDGTVLSDRVTALDFRRDGLTIAAGSGPPSRFGDVKVFAVNSGQLVRDFGEVHSDTVLGLRFAPDGRSLASSSADKTVRILNINDGSVVRSLEGHTHHVLGLAWQDDTQSIASVSADQNVKIWNIETGQQRRTISGFGKEITAIAFVGQTAQVVTACADGQVRLHDTGNGKAIRTFNASGDFLFAVGLTDDGKTLFAGGQSGTLRAWNVTDGKLIYEIK